MLRWFPIARGAEVIPRHILQAQLCGRELALWRDDAGNVNVWDNRCPHRGVRLSIGINSGAAVHCRYHGWRFASGSGRCTLIPSHPTQKPATTIGAGVLASSEHAGYVWVQSEAAAGGAVADTEQPVLPRPGGVAATAQALSLRSLFVEAPWCSLTRELLRGYPLRADRSARVEALDPYTLTTEVVDERAVTFLVQPVADTQTVLHGVLFGGLAPDSRLRALRDHNDRMKRLGESVEATV